MRQKEINGISKRKRGRLLWAFLLVGIAFLLPWFAQAKEKKPPKDNSTAVKKSTNDDTAAQTAADKKPTFKITPYGRVELDVIYSSRGTNPLDPRQFNGYSTAAGPERRASSTFNPRFSVLGLKGNLHDGNRDLDAKVEFDFYSTDAANLITPRLRLAYVQYRQGQTQATFGMDWLPVASLLPDILDFSIMGYGGNLWQRIPQITVRQGIGERWEVLGTVFRFERGFTLQPQVPGPFSDPVRMPYVGTRIAYQKWGPGGAGLFALSGAYRQFNHPLTNRTVKSDLINAEWVVPIASTFRWSGKLGYGQGLGDEFFRFGQAYNVDRPIPTAVGWTQLSYFGIRRWAFAGGWGDDNPKGRDLVGISNNNSNYRHNQRVFFNAVYDAYEHLKVGGEYNYLRTNWTNGDLFRAHQVMASVFFSF